MSSDKAVVETIKDMLADWNAATPEQRENALQVAAHRANVAEAKMILRHFNPEHSMVYTGPAFGIGREVLAESLTAFVAS